MLGVKKILWFVISAFLIGGINAVFKKLFFAVAFSDYSTSYVGESKIFQGVFKQLFCVNRYPVETGIANNIRDAAFRFCSYYPLCLAHPH